MNFVILKHTCQNYLLHHIALNRKAAHSYLAHSKWNKIVILSKKPIALPEMLLLMSFIKFVDLL